MTPTQEHAKRILNDLENLMADTTNDDDHKAAKKASDWLKNILYPLTPEEKVKAKEVREFFMDDSWYIDEKVEDYIAADWDYHMTNEDIRDEVKAYDEIKAADELEGE